MTTQVPATKTPQQTAIDAIKSAAVGRLAQKKPDVKDSSPTEEPEEPSEEPKQSPETPRGHGDAKTEEDDRIPYKRFIESNEAYKAEKARRETVEAELSSLKKKERTDVSAILEQIETKKPKGFDDWDMTKQGAWVSQKVAEQVSEDQFEDQFNGMLPDLKAAATQIRVQRQLGVSVTAEQADALSAIQDDFPKMTPSEAMAVAKMRNPDLFPADGKSKRPPVSHSVQEPRGGKSEPSARDDRGQYSSSRLPTRGEGIEAIAKAIFGKKKR